MVARAEAFESTGERIVAAADALFATLPYDQVSLEAIADGAATSVQTVIRRFGAKDRVFAAVAERRSERIRAGRDAVGADDTAQALQVLLDHYERWGDEILLLLAQEARTPVIAATVHAGRRYHHHWVARVYRPSLTRGTAAQRRQALHQLTAVTDIYTWKIFRRDLGLGPVQARHAIAGLVDGIVAEAGTATVDA